MAKSKTPLLVAAVVGVVAILAVRMISSGLGGGSTDDTGGGGGTGGGGDVAVAGCEPLVVAASSEKAALLTAIGRSYEKAGREVDGTCFDVQVNSVASGSGEAALARGWDPDTDGPRPDVWTPAASTWVGLLKQDLASNDKPDMVPAETPSIASTPLVLAMPRPMATALGWPRQAARLGRPAHPGQRPPGAGPASVTPSGAPSPSARPTRTSPPPAWPRPSARSWPPPASPRT